MISPCGVEERRVFIFAITRPYYSQLPPVFTGTLYVRKSRQKSSRLRVVCNFGDSDRGARENTHARVREILGSRDTAERSAKNEGSAPPLSRIPEISRVCACVFSPAPRSLLPKLETTRSRLLFCLDFTRPTIAIAKIRDYSQSKKQPNKTSASMSSQLHEQQLSTARYSES